MEVGCKNCIAIGIKCRVAKRVGHHLYDMKVLLSPGSPATDWSHLAVPGTADTGQSGATTPPPLFRTLTNKIVFSNSKWLNSTDLDCTNLL